MSKRKTVNNNPCHAGVPAKNVIITNERDKTFAQSIDDAVKLAIESHRNYAVIERSDSISSKMLTKIQKATAEISDKRNVEIYTIPKTNDSYFVLAVINKDLEAGLPFALVTMLLSDLVKDTYEKSSQNNDKRKAHTAIWSIANINGIRYMLRNLVDNGNPRIDIPFVAHVLCLLGKEFKVNTAEAYFVINPFS